ncbi:hypothetical protein I307_05089 [Cryptococcus deuterogattii 99/473]|uniref:GRIP domain-containing protein n=1 Tax=Cryptococcus deuterogattii Ram5 TaxID=1296110 RepID=A0A0D0TA53_9TREE|nr:hypothetical protein I313_01129 [Cryptococcus deuterogattii Ram5]KIY55498.1 hypothetical protein I307_05089 [Cryptococcus deuterogattii 99/473]
MFAVSLQDRLKAAVNSLEATGSSLQARALNANQHPHDTKDSGPQDATSANPPHAPPSPTFQHSSSSKQDVRPKSVPVSLNEAAYSGATTSQLAENALSGLRKSVQFGRSSLDLPNSVGISSSLPATPNGQEVKDISSPSLSASVPAEPSAFAGKSPTASSLEISDATDGPAEIHARSIPLRALTDPISIPLPPSPTLSSISCSPEADPLGASTSDDGVNETTIPRTASSSKNDHKELDTVEKPSINEDEKDLDQPDEEVASTDVKKLADLERRYDDLSNRFTNLLTQTHQANKIFRELTRLESGISDAEALEGWVRMMVGKVEMMGKEMKRLQDNLTLSKLRSDLSESESKLSAYSSTVATLTQVEKEKEELEKDRASERAERSRLTEEMEKARIEKEKEVSSLKKGFERELAGTKERYEKDLKDKKASWELEMITTKTIHALLQSKQAEAESARAEMEEMQTKSKELEFQLREANERCSLLEDSMRDDVVRRGQSMGLAVPETRTDSLSPSRNSSLSGAGPMEIQRLLAESESRAESKLSDLRARIRSLECERNELEEEWAGKMQERVKELEKMRRVLLDKEKEHARSLEGLRERESRIQEVEQKTRDLEAEISRMKLRMEEVEGDKSVASESEASALFSTIIHELVDLHSQLDDSKSHISFLKSTNKTLRDEMRKIQSSIQLMEKQRNPGVGYWAAAGGQRSNMVSPPMSNVNLDSPAPGRKSAESIRTATGTEIGSELGESKRTPEEEDLNLEYLRNVILQFLEHKEMRPNLVRVMSVILRFTPQELRRLNAKLLS